MSTCASCGSPNRTLLLTVTDRKGTRRVGTCCYDPSREVVPAAAPVFNGPGRSVQAPAKPRAAQLDLKGAR